MRDDPDPGDRLRGDGMTAGGEQGTTVTTVERSGRVRDQDDQREEASIAE